MIAPTVDTKQTAEDPLAWRICAVVVTYHPDDGIADRARAIAGQADGLIIVDNGSPRPAVLRLEALAADERIRLVRNPSNLGIARALNQGVEYARVHGYTHALLLDQDTEPLPHLVRTLREIAARRCDIDRVAVLAANLKDGGTGAPAYRFRRGRGEATELTTVMTSGSLLNLTIACTLGPFREDFFIDRVDEEYCLRARVRGYKVLLTHEALAVHALGAPKFGRILGLRFGTLNHSAIRRYYMVRNHVFLTRMYAIGQPRWIARSLWLGFKGFLLLLALDDDRVTKVAFTTRGLRDGLAGRAGKLAGPDAPAEPF
jgi:rhamnosyltransferase